MKRGIIRPLVLALYRLASGYTGSKQVLVGVKQTDLKQNMHNHNALSLHNTKNALTACLLLF